MGSLPLERCTGSARRLYLLRGHERVRIPRVPSDGFEPSSIWSHTSCSSAELQGDKNAAGYSSSGAAGVTRLSPGEGCFTPPISRPATCCRWVVKISPPLIARLDAATGGRPAWRSSARGYTPEEVAARGNDKPLASAPCWSRTSSGRGRGEKPRCPPLGVWCMVACCQAVVTGLCVEGRWSHSSPAHDCRRACRG